MLVMKRLNLLAGAFVTLGMAFAADPALLGAMMKDPSMVAGIDIQRAKNSPFGQKMLAEFKEEDKGFQKLMTATGFDPRRDLREVVLASTAQPGTKTSRTLVAVSGTFDVTRISRFLQSEGSTSLNYQGYEVWSGKHDHDKGGMVFLNGTTALMGDLEAVKEALDRRATGGPNTEMSARVAEWSARNDAWFVSSPNFQDVQVGKAGSNQILPQGLPLHAIRQASAGVRFGSNLEISAEAVARSEKDATALADVVRFLGSMVRLNSDKPEVSELSKAVDSLQVSSTGETMRFSLSVPEEQIQKMLQPRQRASRSTI